MTQLFAVVQIGIRGVRMEMEILLRHVQGSRTREGCRKKSKSPRESASEHKKMGKIVIFQRRRGMTGV